MAAKKAGEGWSDIDDWDVADGSAEPVLGKLEFAAELDGLLSAREIMASKAAAWLLCVGLDVISQQNAFSRQTKGRTARNRARSRNDSQ